MIALLCSCTDLVMSDLQWRLVSIIRVSSNEVLKQQFGVSEITGIILEGLPMASDKSFLKVSAVPDPSLHVFTLEKWLPLLDEFISTHLNVLVEKVATQHLLSVFSVEELRVHERVSEDSLCDELEVLVMEEQVIVVEEQEREH
jgi:hypothetical protein